MGLGPRGGARSRGEKLEERLVGGARTSRGASGPRANLRKATVSAYSISSGLTGGLRISEWTDGLGEDVEERLWRGIKPGDVS